MGYQNKKRFLEHCGRCEMECSLRRIAHPNTKNELNEAISDLRNWKLYQEKTENMGRM